MDFDFLSSNLHIQYPFRDDVGVIRPSGAVSIKPLVAAIRAYTADQRSAELCLDEIDVRSSDSWTTLDTAEITLRWTDDDEQFTLTDGITAVAKVVKYGSWIVVRWRSTSEPDFALHVVFPTSVVAAGTFRFWKDVENVVILSSVVKQGPNKVRRIYLKRGDTLTQLAGPGDEFVIQPGFNVEMTAGSDAFDGGRKLTTVAINAVPAAGLGKYLLCPSIQYLRTINGTGADSTGNTQLAPEECYWLDIPVKDGPTPIVGNEHDIDEVATLEPNQLGLHNTCTACCSCANYIKAYDNLRNIWNNAKDVSDAFKNARDSYHATLLLFEKIVPEGSTLTLVQRDNSLLAVMRVMNNTLVESTDPVTASLVFTLPDGATYTYRTSVVTGLGTPRTITPENITTAPAITVDEALQPSQSFFWSTSWIIGGMDLGDILDVTAIVSGGVTDTETKSIVWE